ncbi:unnamed protein product, partial [Heterosigma akashiwo]
MIIMARNALLVAVAVLISSLCGSIFGFRIEQKQWINTMLPLQASHWRGLGVSAEESVMSMGRDFGVKA